MSFWVKSTNNFGGEQGSDGSDRYMTSRSLKFFIMDWNTKRAVSFKPFIESLSYDFTYELGSSIVESLYKDGESKQVKDLQVKYSFSLNLVSHSLSEARVNLSKINELVKFKSVTKAETGIDNSDFYTANTFGVYFSNLVSNGRATGGVDIDVFNFAENALWGYIESFKFDEASELGFFEEKEKLYPKIIKLSFDFLVSFRANKEILKEHCEVTDKNDLFLPFNRSGAYYTSDIKSWPFGVKKSESSIGRDGKYDYGNNKKAYVTISNNRCLSKSVNFLMFIESLSITYESKSEDHASVYPLSNAKIKGGNTYKFEVSFSVPAHSLGEAKNNLFLFQELLRIVNNFNNIVEETNIVATTGSGGSFVLPEDEDQARLVKARFFQLYRTSYDDSKNNTQKQDFLKKYYKNSSGVRYNFNNTIPENLLMVSNLINRGDSTLPSTYAKSGVPCIVESIKFDPEIDMGFFEENNMLYFKSYKVSLSCVAVEVDDFQTNPAYTINNALGNNETEILRSKKQSNYNSIMLADDYNVISKLGD